VPSDLQISEIHEICKMISDERVKGVTRSVVENRRLMIQQGITIAKISAKSLKMLLCKRKAFFIHSRAQGSAKRHSCPSLRHIPEQSSPAPVSEDCTIPQR
jgi:hypothetical protein